MLGKVSLDKLMRITSSIQVKVRGKELVVYLRTLSVNDDAARRSFAFAAARSARMALRQEGSDLYEQKVAFLRDATPEEMIEIILSARRVRYWQEAINTIHQENEPEPPDNPSIGEILDAEEQEEAEIKSVEQKRQAYVDEQVTVNSEALRNRAAVELYTEALEAQTEMCLTDIYNRAWNQASLYGCCWQDKSFRTRFFDSPLEAGEMAPELQASLLTAYYELDSWTEEELKN